jgi:hypothetical protein
MSAVATTNEVLKEYPLIKEVLRREVLQGCTPRPGAEDRILKALVKAIDQEVSCCDNTGRIRRTGTEG